MTTFFIARQPGDRQWVQARVYRWDMRRWPNTVSALYTGEKRNDA
jgi:hypothetical protein